ncbi:MAG: hypothetical protein K9M03_04750 [Kiritimatiellales bacterium]|nr:hypothetical protein [Kiritimatiellales bacterium]
MNKSLRFILWGCATIFALFAASIALPFLMQAVGYYTLEPGWKVAQQLVEDGKDVHECKKIVRAFWFDLSPPTSQQRSMCIREYAELTQDPTACELLMPSDYGWSCLGAARENGEICSINYARDVSWWEKSPFDQPSKATMNECKKGMTETVKGEKCCYILQLTSEPSIDDCSRFKSDEPFLDLCLSQLAMKKKDGRICEGITDDNARTICEIKIKYL